MPAQTNMEQIRSLAKSMLMLDIQPTSLSPIFVKHPFTDTGITGIRKADGSFIMGNLMESEADLEMWRKQVRKQIDCADSPISIALFVTNAFSFAFLKYAAPYLCKRDLAELLAYIWINRENTHADPNLSPKKLLRMFMTADPASLMDAAEIAVLNGLPDSVIVYRGVTSFNADKVKGLSWTLDTEKANWFAHRFGENGTVYRAEIAKEHIHAYFSGRGEAEVIVDPKHLENIQEYDN